VSIRRLVVTIFTVAALAVPASAMAQDPIVQGYGGRGPTVENQITPPGQVEAEVVSTPQKTQNVTPTPPEESAPTAASQPPSAKGSLPFTGLDARLLALAGIALAGIGFATRRLAQRID
jgi:Tfp pilus assembly protein FimV